VWSMEHSSVAERLTVNQVVVGSIPTAPVVFKEIKKKMSIRITNKDLLKSVDSGDLPEPGQVNVIELY
jgi:hypothetical protein